MVHPLLPERLQEQHRDDHPLLPSLECSSKGWFASEEKDSTNLFDYADEMMSDSLPLPLLRTKQDEHWMAEYNSVKWARGRRSSV